MGQVASMSQKAKLKRVSKGEILVVKPIASEPRLPLWMCEAVDDDAETDAAPILDVNVLLPFGAMLKAVYARPFKFACKCAINSIYHELGEECHVQNGSAGGAGEVTYKEGHGKWRASIDRSQIVMRSVSLNNSGTICARGDVSSSRDLFEALEDCGAAGASMVPPVWAPSVNMRRATGKGARTSRAKEQQSS